jgi:hypothetical protein
MSQETLNEYDEREKELLKLEQRWRTKILAAESRKRRKYITKEWRRQNTALRKAWAKRICKAAKNDYRRWFDTVAQGLVGWLEHPNQATGQAQAKKLLQRLQPRVRTPQSERSPSPIVVENRATKPPPEVIQDITKIFNKILRGAP